MPGGAAPEFARCPLRAHRGGLGRASRSGAGARPGAQWPPLIRGFGSFYSIIIWSRMPVQPLGLPSAGGYSIMYKAQTLNGNAGVKLPSVVDR